MTRTHRTTPFNGDALFFFRGRLVSPIKKRSGQWLFTMVVRCGNETYFPTITLTTAPSKELRYLKGATQKQQQLISVLGIPQTKNVTYSTIGEIGYLLRRAGYAGLITLFKRMLPAQAQEAPQKHVRYNFMARPEDITIEETPLPEKAEESLPEAKSAVVETAEPSAEAEAEAVETAELVETAAVAVEE